MAFTGLRKCASSPSLSTSERSQQLEIYCGKRPLVELSQKVPARWHGMMQDIGVSHYYVVVWRPFCADDWDSCINNLLFVSL